MFLLNNKKIFLFFVGFIFAFSFGRVEAATLYLSPQSTEVNVGNIVSLQLNVDTLGKVINNAESVVEFPQDLLEVVSISKSSSIFSLWVSDPSFSNDSGQIVFNGGVPNPGFQGRSGKIISITFRAKKSGTATVSFSDSAVRENDGLGTDILSNKISSQINIVEAENNTKPVQESTPDVSNPPLVITSSTHPKQDSWYSKSNVELAWTLPDQVKSMKTLLDSNQNSSPTISYKKPISSKSIKNVEDGVSYFHVNYQRGGSWSKTSTFKLQIDTVSPKNVSIEVAKNTTSEEVLALSAEDSMSGIDYFAVSIDGGKSDTVKADGSGHATLGVGTLTSGNHDISLKAYDRAGNVAENSVSISIEKKDEIHFTKYSQNIKAGEKIVAEGVATKPNSDVNIVLSNDKTLNTFKVVSDGVGKFTFESEVLSDPSLYTLGADLINRDGSIGASSDRVNIKVARVWKIDFGSINNFGIILLIPLLGLLFILLFLAYYGWHKYFALRRSVRKDLDQTQGRIKQEFKILSFEAVEEMNNVIKKGKSKVLTAKEKQSINSLKETISEVDESLHQLIQKIKDDVK